MARWRYGRSEQSASRREAEAGDAGLRSEADPTTELVGRIYEAAVIPELWKPLLDELARATGSVGGVLFSAREVSLQWIVSDALQAIYEQFIGGGWDTVNRRPARLMQINKA